MISKAHRALTNKNSLWQNLLFAKQRLMRFKFIYPIMLDWKKITKIDSYIYLRTKNRNKIANDAYKLLLKADPLLPHKINTKYLFIKSLIRQDYDEFFDKVFRQVVDNKEKINITYRFSDSLYFVRLLKIVFYWPIFFKIYHKNLKVSFYCYVKAISYIGVLKIIDSYSFKYLVSFADMQGVENMIVQYYNRKNICTVTMQHGLYVDYTHFDNINTVNYENVVSKYFLAWGEETSELIYKYHPNTKIKICGKPINISRYSSASDFFTVVFDQSLFTQQNRELLEIAYCVSEIVKLNINVRLHPWDQKERYSYKNNHTSFDKDIFRSRFVLGHTTSMIFECMRIGIPAFKYKTNFPSNIIQEDLTFNNVDSLMQRIKNIKEYNFTALGKFYIEFVGNESLAKYADFFNRLSNGELTTTK